MTIKSGQRLFVLDTNVLMHDPGALFRFQEHDIYLPMVVLEELDAAKKGLSELSRNVRQVTRFLDEIIGDADTEKISQGLKLSNVTHTNGGVKPDGCLFLQTQLMANQLPETLPGKNADNTILGTTLSLQEKFSDKIVTLVSKDINLRIKARVLGIHTEDYYNDKVLDDADLLYTGIQKLPDDFWQKNADNISSWQKNKNTYYKLAARPNEDCYPYQCLYTEDENKFEAIVESMHEQVTLRLATNYRAGHHSVWGINARNLEQNFALNLLMDPEVDLVTLLGSAGTGKTLLALAAGLLQTMETKRYREIIITRVTVPVGEDIGFLPGTEEEKMAPWMGALLDNLEVLTNHEDNNEWARAATADLLNKRIKIRSLNFMRGRTFLNRYIIVDEAQNLTSKQMKTLISRVGPDSKMVCQISPVIIFRFVFLSELVTVPVRLALSQKTPPETPHTANSRIAEIIATGAD
jgi:PhoH-like ATPase